MDLRNKRLAPGRTTGFTLVELLVVITIITVLLAILVPAVESARMQSKLAACGANLKTVAGAATMYAFDHQEYYPDRHPKYFRDARHIRIVQQSDPPSDYDTPFDLRPKFGAYMAMKAFTEPLLGDTPPDDSYIPANSNINAPFNIYSSWHTEDALDIMEKVGQRFEAEVGPVTGGPRTYRSNIIAGDRNSYSTGLWNLTRSSHPDRLTPPILRPRYIQWRPTPEGLLTFSGWHSVTGADRPVDLNFAYADGSVIRFNGVLKDDPRMAKIIPTDLTSPSRNYDERGPGMYDNRLYEHLPKN